MAIKIIAERDTLILRRATRSRKKTTVDNRRETFHEIWILSSFIIVNRQRQIARLESNLEPAASLSINQAITEHLADGNFSFLFSGSFNRYEEPLPRGGKGNEALTPPLPPPCLGTQKSITQVGSRSLTFFVIDR